MHSYISTFRSMFTVLKMTVFSSLISSFPSRLFWCCLSNSEMVPFAPIITGITFSYTFHMGWISIINPFVCVRIFSAYLLTLILLTWRKWWTPNNTSKWQMEFNSAFKGFITFLSPEVVTSISIQVTFSVSLIIMSG